MRKLLAILALLALSPLVPFSAADLAIKGELVAEQYKIVRLAADGAPTGAGFIWDYDEDKLDAIELGGRLYLTGPPGTYRVRLRAITVTKEGGTSIESAKATITIKGKIDPGPKPPEPGPGPTPDPGPNPDAPIPGVGLRVLIVYESAELQKYPQKQIATIYSKLLRDYLSLKCAVGPDAKTPEWRMYDKDIDVTSESKTWQDAMKRPRKSLPWIIVSNGKTGYEGPLPADLALTLELVKKYAP